VKKLDLYFMRPKRVCQNLEGMHVNYPKGHTPPLVFRKSGHKGLRRVTSITPPKYKVVAFAGREIVKYRSDRCDTWKVEEQDISTLPFGWTSSAIDRQIRNVFGCSIDLRGHRH
jgi:hypothetical protein